MGLIAEKWTSLVEGKLFGMLTVVPFLFQGAMKVCDRKYKIICGGYCHYLFFDRQRILSLV